MRGGRGASIGQGGLLKTYTIIILFFLVSNISFACQCPVTVLNETETNKYDLIFKGKIISINLKADANSEAIFELNELYKGNSRKQFEVLFNNADPCKLEMRLGEEWIIYTNYKQIDNAKLDFCSRSRKFFRNQKEDFFEITSGLSYGEEVRYLQNKLGLHKLLRDDINKVENRNKIPSKNQFTIILICSLAGIIVFYWLIKKLLK